jgi:hypothetical protein
MANMKPGLLLVDDDALIQEMINSGLFFAKVRKTTRALMAVRAETTRRWRAQTFLKPRHLIISEHWFEAVAALPEQKANGRTARLIHEPGNHPVVER